MSIYYRWSGVPDDVKEMWLATVKQSSFVDDRFGMRLVMGYTEVPAEDPEHTIGVRIERDAPGQLDFTAYVTLRPISDDLMAAGDMVMHALGHVVIDGCCSSVDIYHEATRDDTHGPDPDDHNRWRREISGWFTNPTTGQPGNSSDYFDKPFADSTLEAACEFFKDVYRTPRKSNNRTNWKFNQLAWRPFTTFMGSLLCPPEPS